MHMKKHTPSVALGSAENPSQQKEQPKGRVVTSPGLGGLAWQVWPASRQGPCGAADALKAATKSTASVVTNFMA